MVSAFCFSSQVNWDSQYTFLDLVIHMLKIQKNQAVLHTHKKNLCLILKSETVKSGGKGRGPWVSLLSQGAER